MSSSKQPSDDPIPQFATREEEAEFWDTHDFTDYWDELEPANLKAGPNVASSILVSLDGDSLSQIYQHADAKGVNAENLVRTWILERLQATPMRLRPTIVCYADILGFRAETQRAFRSGSGEDFLQRIKGALEKAYGTVREVKSGYPPGASIFDMKVFTDNIVVAYPLGDWHRNDGEIELGTILTLFAQVQTSLALDGFFLRGAIAYGDHYQDDDVAYGDALLEAVGLDHSGGPPRLTIAPSVEPLIAQHLSYYGDFTWAPHYQQILEDPVDERLFVDYLGSELDLFPHYPIHAELLPAHRECVLKGLRDHKSDQSVWSKYMWLASYHNYSCRSFAERWDIQAPEAADDEQLAYSADAQHALDFLVPFETGQCPRPLDAHRLRSRLRAD